MYEHAAGGDVEQGLLGGFQKFLAPAQEQASGFANKFVAAIRSEDGG
jgi:hypothetical protein